MPNRIQRSLAKGWRMPEGAIYVGRTSGGPTRWSNPFRIGGWFMIGDPNPSRRNNIFRMAWCESYLPGEPGFTLIETRAQAVEWFRHLAANWSPEMLARLRRELGGHDLCCWCPPDQPCHADVLIEIANG